MSKTITYRDILLPEHFSLINQAPQQQIAVPAFFQRGDLRDLFTSSADDLLREQGFEHVSLKDAPIDKKVKDIFSAPGKTTMNTVMNHALVRVFSMWGYASSLGREVHCMATHVDQSNQLKPQRGNLPSNQVDPKFFETFESDPISGAQAFFAEIDRGLNQPQRAAVFGIIKPPSRQ